MRRFFGLLVVFGCVVTMGFYEDTDEQIYHVVSVKRQLKDVLMYAIKAGYFFTFFNMIDECRQDGFFRARPFSRDEFSRIFETTNHALLFCVLNNIGCRARTIDYFRLDERYPPGTLFYGIDWWEVRKDICLNIAYTLVCSITNARHLYTLLSDRSSFLVPDASLADERCPVCFRDNDNNSFVAPCGFRTHFLCVQCYRRLSNPETFKCLFCVRVIPRLPIIRRSPSVRDRARLLITPRITMALFVLWTQILLLVLLRDDIVAYRNAEEITL